MKICDTERSEIITEVNREPKGSTKEGEAINSIQNGESRKGFTGLVVQELRLNIGSFSSISFKSIQANFWIWLLSKYTNHNLGSAA